MLIAVTVGSVTLLALDLAIHDHENVVGRSLAALVEAALDARSCHLGESDVGVGGL